MRPSAIPVVLILASSLQSSTLQGGEPGQRPTRPRDNPILVLFVIHLDPLQAPKGSPAENYKKQRDNLAWLADYFEQIERDKGLSFVPKLTLEFGGDHAEYYAEDPEGLALLKRLYSKGHILGVHFHTGLKEGPHRWVELRAPGAATQITQELRARVTAAHIEEVDLLVGKVLVTTDAAAIRAANHTIQGHIIDTQLAAEKGFNLTTTGTSEVFVGYFGHDPYNPWAMATKGEGPLAEDRDSRWIMIPGASVLGNIGKHTAWTDLSIPSFQRKCWQTYLEWRHWTRDLNRNDERVWAFGWHEHTANLDTDDGIFGNPRNLRDEVKTFVTWINEKFINQRDPQRGLVAKYATAHDVESAFRSWQTRHPGQSSFNYTARGPDWNRYPYKLVGVARELMYAHLDEEIITFREQGVMAQRLVRTEGPSWRYHNGKIVSAEPTSTVYLLWSDAGEKTIDFSSVCKGKVHCVAGTQAGSETIQEASSLRVDEVPMVCIPESSRGTPASPTATGAISGRIKSVDVEKNTLTVTVGDKDQVFSVAGARLIKPDGGEIAGGLKAVKTFLDRQALTVTFKTEKKDGKEVVTEVRFEPAGRP